MDRNVWEFLVYAVYLLLVLDLTLLHLTMHLSFLHDTFIGILKLSGFYITNYNAIMCSFSS
jgi:hypothetical protein